MSVTQYIGARYVPLFADPLTWDITKAYEALTIVYYQGNSYTSRQAVPAGIDITNDTYWALTGNYNAQIEQYRAEVQAYDGRITANTASNTAQDAQLAGTSSSGLKTLIDANTSSNTAQDAQLAGTSTSGLKTLIDTNASDIDALEQSDTAISAQLAGTSESGLKTLIDANASDITTLESQMAATSESGLLSLINQLAEAPNGILIEGARPILRIETPTTEGLQGGTFFKQGGVNYYAIARIVSGSTATKVDIYNLDSGNLVATCTGSFAHGNAMSYDNGHIYVGGAEDSAVFVDIDVTSVTTPYVARNIDLSSVGESKVWAFGVYDADHFWYTPNNNAIYLVTKQVTDKTLLCYAPNPEYMQAVQQGISYDQDSDTFISCKSSYLTLFDSEGTDKGGYRFDWQYGYTFTCEVEQATQADGIIYFHNNAALALPAGMVDYRYVHTVYAWDPAHPVYQEPAVMPLGARQININSTAPKVPDFDRVAPDTWHYPLDAAAYMLAHPEGGRGITLASDTPFVIVVPPNVNTVNLGGHAVGGVAIMNGACISLTGNVAYTASSPELSVLTTTINGRKALSSGRSSLFTFFGTEPGDTSVWVHSLYGGAAIATAAKLAFVNGTGGRITI